VLFFSLHGLAEAINLFGRLQLLDQGGARTA